MKNSLSVASVIILTLSIIYAGFAYCNIDLNPLNWPFLTRVFYSMLSICLSVSIGIAWSHDLKAASKKQKSGTDLSNVLCEYLPSVDSQIEFFAAAALSGTLSRPQLTTPEKAAEWSLKCALELDKKLKDHLSKSSAENEQRVGMTIC